MFEVDKKYWHRIKKRYYYYKGYLPGTLFGKLGYYHVMEECGGNIKIISKILNKKEWMKL